MPSCDGSGVVLAIGPSVLEFKVGDRIITHLGPWTVETRGDDAAFGLSDIPPALGQGSDGTLRSHAVFSEKALAHAPVSLDFLPAATLTCTWLTAWNALFGLEGRKVGPASWILVQGTGGVSVAALQIAVAAGATVVATTSAEERALRLTALGAKHVLNYRVNPKWGAEARALTPENRGFDIVIDVGGDETLPQSLAAVRNNGVVLIIGGVGSASEAVPMLSALLQTCIIRGILAGSRTQLKEVVRFIDDKGINPAVDDVVFELAEAKAAYRRLKEKKHFSKVLIRIDHEN